MARIKGMARKGQDKAAGMNKARDLCKIATARALKVKRSEIAVLLNTSHRMIDRWVTQHREFLDEFGEFVLSVLPKPNLTEIDVANEAQYVASLRQRLGRLVGVLDRALADSDIKVALGAAVEINKVLGLNQKMTVEHKGRVQHDHEHKVVPAGLLATVNKPRERRALPPITYTQVSE